LITRIAPNNGSVAGGTVVTITGGRFPAGARVKFGSAGARAVSVHSSTSITAISPAGAGTAHITVGGSEGTSPRTAYDSFAYDPPPSGDWLGLNGNSATYLGPVGQFVAHHIVYDRDEYRAGQLPAGNDSLHRAIAHHMIPDVVVEYAGYTGRGFGRELSPGRSDHAIRSRLRPDRDRDPPRVSRHANPVRTDQRALRARRACAVRRRDREAAAGGTTSRHSAGKRLRRRLRQGVGAGHVRRSTTLRMLVQGWYLHPYGPPSGEANGYSAGIQSLPYVQAEMTSGQNNIIVSEIGWCALDVNHGNACGEPRARSARQAARRLTEGLDKALPMRRAGWLRALLVYSRNDGGWAMQTPPGILTEQGRALIRFARAHPDR
jgi:IPT/TIG domain